MADSKITGLTGDTAPTSDDLVMTVNDPVGTPANKKVALGNAFQAFVDNFQADTSNAAVTKPRVEVGWGVGTPGAGSAVLSETVTFHTAFSAAPVVLSCYGGDDTGNSSTYGAGGVDDAGSVTAWAHTITASTFIARLQRAGTWNGTTTVFYQWIAIGPT